MKTSFPFLVFSSVLLSLIITSCGPGKKLTASMSKVDKLQIDSVDTHRQLNACNAQLTDYNTEVNNLKAQKTSLENENTAAHKELNQLSE